MHETLLVRCLQRRRYLECDGQRFVGRHGPACETLGEVLARDELEHEKAQALSLFQAVDGADVGVVQRGEQSGFALEA